MKIINISKARSNLFKLVTDLSAGDDPIAIQSKNGRCILMSEQEWNDINETIYLLTNPKTRKDIMNASPLSECVRVKL